MIFVLIIRMGNALQIFIKLCNITIFPYRFNRKLIVKLFRKFVLFDKYFIL